MTKGIAVKPPISRRARVMPSSPIRKLVPFAEEARRRGITVYHLNIGQPDIPTPEGMLDAFRHHQLTVLAYGHSGGLWEYREGLSRYYHRHGIEVTKEQVLVTTAGSEAVIFALMAIADPGDEIVLPEPFYTNYNGFAVETGVKLVPVPSRPEEGYRLPPSAEIRARIGPRTRGLLLCNPNNPTGYVYTRDEVERLKALALEHDLFLLSDEVYREFVYDGARHCSALHLDGIDDRAILLDSISKRYSACGARIGCLVTRNEEVLETCLRFGQARLCPPTLEQMAANAALDTPESYLDGVRDEYRRRRDVVFEALAEMPGVEGKKPGGAFYAMVKLPVDDADAFCAWLLVDFEDRGETVMLAPANGFYATPGLGRQEVRIAFVLNVEAMRRGMELLAKALREYPGRTVA
jgi:aspartate aminotransferase